MQNGGTYMFGLRFRYIDGDYDWWVLKSVRYRYSRKLYEYMLKCKYENERDYTRCEYDCTGSTQTRIYIKHKGRFLFMWVRETKDV